MRIDLYNPARKEEWDACVKASRNGTFLHLRDYMDYHSDRFADSSLMAFDAKDRLIAVLPAHRCDRTLASHRGLTYGGWLMTPRADMEAMLEVWAAASQTARELGFCDMIYRPVPHIYHKYPAEEDLYALWRAGANLEAVQASSTIDLTAPLGFDMAARQSVRKSTRAGITVQLSDDYEVFWQVLAENLMASHNATPVHSIAEIRLLRSRFPENIKLYTATLEGRILAGVVIYESETVAHSQYGSASPEGKKLRAMTVLYHHIIAEAAAAGKRYFDFGTSCEDGGRFLNLGLIRQKCGFGGRVTTYNSYKITL